MIGLTNRPPFAALTHVGRTSGREYRIPVTPFRTESGFLFALTYGSEADWVKNVMAANGARLEYDGETFSMTAPELQSRTQAWRDVPGPARPFLMLLRVGEFLRMDID